ncbi:hypothetical protein [Enterococcus sp.]|jgi:NADH:ubiquinone oxidoreductase subunit E|uniref:hypothetical protein n=1 Tax=Enterococcus sp. TaxID=35783 RepID=UPI0025C3132B|nr:hypothetical protein [Enterococcus sp.]
MTEREFERQLQRFLRLLVKEKEYLIKGQGEKLIELVEKKESFVPIIESYDGSLSTKSQELIQQIQWQQEENLLLTEQAISYQKTLMDAVKDNIQPVANTYSKYTEKATVQTAIIDQKI